MSALLATVQRDITLGAVTAEIDAARQGRRAVVTAGRGNGLNQARQPRSSDIQGRPWAGRLRGAVAVAAISGTAVRIHITVLPVLSIAIHGD